MARRDWTVQAGGLVGKRLGNFHLTLDGSADVLGEHDGYELTLSGALVMSADRWEVVPELKATWESEALLNHYFGVRTLEALPGRPAYMPGSAVTWTAILDTSYRITPRWYVSASASFEVLPDEIRNSPLVDKDTTWRVNLGIAYDVDAFVEAADRGRSSQFDLSVGAFFSTAESNFDFLDDVGGAQSFDLESESGLQDNKNAVLLDAVWEIGRYHRFEAGYFSLNRSGSLGSLDTSLDTESFKLGYGFSILRDTQKDLALFGGVHVTKVRFSTNDAAQPLAAETTAFLPVIGARFRANITERFSAGAMLDIFVLDVDRHNGQALDFSFNGTWALADWLLVDGGYRFVRQDLDVADKTFLGDYRIDYRGPFVKLRARF